MFKRMSVVICGLAVTMMTAGYASAQTATEKTKQAAKDTGEAITDASITAAVKTKLLADTKVGGLKIDVDTKDHVVTLTGPVSSAAERAEAVRLAKTTTGVKSVVNKLVVDPSNRGVTDKDDKAKAAIKDEAKDAKDATKGTTGKAVDATKKGAEKTGDAAKKAGEKTKDVAQDVAGKTKDAAIKTKDVTADAATTAAVKTKLLGDTKVGGLKIDVDTKDNVVTLTGTVSSAEEKAEALRLARTTTGVKRVIDKLTVR
jgi:hyperosmotically inducible periplasmic protein